MAYWNFPAVAGGNINSINNAGLETFRDNPIDSLTREVPQNSLDAEENPSQPVIVEFKKFTLNTFPGRSELDDALKKCEKTWGGVNKKSYNFIKTARSILAKRYIECLRISDYNTTGLKGAKEAKLGSPWSSLIRETGSSNKEDDSGGSIGIGKSAPFICSNLRTLFYSSQDTEGYKSHIGVADIMSFREENNKVTLGKGYFTDSDNSHAVEGLLNLDSSFIRQEPGTDIFITSFNGDENWEKDMIRSVLKNFFVTIYQRQLIVKIEGFEITHNNIAELIGQLEDNDENQILKQYFKLLASNQTIRIPYPKKTYKNGIVFEEGEAELLLKGGEDLNRRVLVTRKNGMRIYEQNNISGSISFTGLLVMKGKNMNKIFKQMENPTHNAWLPSRYVDDPKLAEKVFADLRRFFREKVKETFQQTTPDMMNAVGLSDFLPNKNLLNDDGEDKAESIRTRIKSIGYKEIEQYKSNDYQFNRGGLAETEEQMLGEYGISSGEQGGGRTVKDSVSDKPGVGVGGKSSGGDGDRIEPNGENGFTLSKDGDVGIKKKETKKSNPILLTQQKYACIDKKQGQYRFTIILEKEIMKGCLKFKVIGEQSDFDLPIKQAQFNNPDIIVESISENTIYFSTSRKTVNLNMNIQVDYTDYCVMGVGVYENK